MYRLNINYKQDDPFQHRPHGLEVESVNNFIMLGASFEGKIDMKVPEQFKHGANWINDGLTRPARFVKAGLTGFNGVNNGDVLKFSKNQKGFIKIEIFMQMLDQVEKLWFEGLGLENLKVNVLKKYPVINNNDILIEDLDLNEPLVNIKQDDLINTSFVLELIAQDNNIQLKNIGLTIKTKKIGGAGDINIDGNHIYIDGDRENILPIFTKNEFFKLFNQYMKRDLTSVSDAENYLNDPNTPDGAIVLLPKEALQ